jgi:hypothetical protein
VLTLQATSTCPSGQDVARELSPLLPNTEFAEHAPDVAEIVDDGTSFRVSLGTQSKRFADAERDCRERARIAAVFIGLLLDPPESLLPPEPVPEPRLEEPEAPRPPPRRPVERPSRLDFELGPALLVAPTASATAVPVLGGISARASWGKEVRLAAGVLGLFPTTLHYETADARVHWLPVDLAIRLRRPGPELDMAGELGVAVAVLRARGERVDISRQETRLELGARAGVVLRNWFSESLGAHVSLNLLWFPAPKELMVRPDERLGTTPSVWVGASAGVVWSPL